MMNNNRRTFLKFLSTPYLSYAILTIPVNSSASQSTLSLIVDYMPVFYIGDPDSKVVIDFFWSGSCKKTKLVLKEYLLDFCESIKENNKAVIIFHHIVSNKTEKAAGVELLSVGRKQYPSFCYETLKWATLNKKRLSKRRINKRIKKLKITTLSSFNKMNAETALYQERNNFDEMGYTETPVMHISGKKVPLPLSESEFIESLKKHSAWV